MPLKARFASAPVSSNVSIGNVSRSTVKHSVDGEIKKAYTLLDNIYPEYVKRQPSHLYGELSITMTNIIYHVKSFIVYEAILGISNPVNCNQVDISLREAVANLCKAANEARCLRGDEITSIMDALGLAANYCYPYTKPLSRSV